jgi:indole-3-acetate monooxygenase
VYTSSPLERCFRDVHVAAQHAAVGLFSLETIGAALMHTDETQWRGGSLI